MHFYFRHDVERSFSKIFTRVNHFEVVVKHVPEYFLFLDSKYTRLATENWGYSSSYALMQKSESIGMHAYVDML